MREWTLWCMMTRAWRAAHAGERLDESVWRGRRIHGAVVGGGEL